MRLFWLVLPALLAAAPLRAQDPLAVEILTLTSEARTHLYQLAGTIEAPQTISASFRNGGRILSVSVNPGDRVALGDEIARVDPTQAKAALDAAAATLAGAEAALTEAAANLGRVQTRLAGGVATRAELDAATQTLAGAQAQRDQAAARLSTATRALDDTVLRAPKDAIVTNRSAEPGQIAGPGQPVVALASGTRREAVFYAPDSIDLEAFLHQPITLTLIGRDAPTLAATLTEVSPVVDAATGTVRVKALLTDPPADDPLLGAPVLGQIPVPLPPAIHLPWDALTATAAGPSVWTVDPATMTVSLAPVTIASFGEADVTITSGLAPGQQVVGAGSQLLFPERVVVAAQGAP